MFKSKHFQLFYLILAVAIGISGFQRTASTQDIETPAESDIKNGAVVVMYQRFGENRYPTTSTSISTLTNHIQELQNKRYSVLPLSDIVEALTQDQPLPDRAIAITIDDAYVSFYENAWPEFKKAGLAITLFITTSTVDQNRPGYMTWSQIRELASDPLVTIGNHANELRHIAHLPIEEQKQVIEKSNQTFRRALGKQPYLFAYPYGEISNSLQNVLKANGFKAAFGQHSGAIARKADLMSLPRYPFNDRFGTMERFKLAINSLPLPVSAVLPENLTLNDSTNPPLFGFTIGSEIKPREDGSYRGLNCYSSQGELTLQELGGGRIEVRLIEPFKQGRARINCTMLGPKGRWRWFGQQFYIP
ncbi:polysaccharide deacetylase family protein [Kiloniella sp. EL199]|uniref:polysaccharide deacetylase family protein n=1 Tax=Kiloniella sp. EL199 TaxID=2107581 RepID=UPI000EA0C9B8|nr:polysaccharide deacetylase family protein [Kiloniella sp. EL199]